MSDDGTHWANNWSYWSNNGADGTDHRPNWSHDRSNWSHDGSRKRVNGANWVNLVVNHFSMDLRHVVNFVVDLRDAVVGGGNNRSVGTMAVGATVVMMGPGTVVTTVTTVAIPVVAGMAGGTLLPLGDHGSQDGVEGVGGRDAGVGHGDVGAHHPEPVDRVSGIADVLGDAIGVHIAVGSSGDPVGSAGLLLGGSASVVAETEAAEIVLAVELRGGSPNRQGRRDRSGHPGSSHWQNGGDG